MGGWGLSSAELMREASKPAQGGRYTLVRDLDANVAHFNEVLGLGTSYDVILRRMRLDGVQVASYVINGLFDNLVDIEILRQISWSGPNSPQADRGSGGPHDERDPDASGRDDSGSLPTGSRLDVLRTLLEEKLTHSQVSVVHNFDDAAKLIMSGPMIILVDGEASAIKVDIRDYPDRMPGPPDVEQLILGPQDGFVESIIDNTTLVRRRVRDPGLRFEIIEIGQRSKTDVAITYIEGLTDPRLVREVKRRLKTIVVDGIPAGEQPVAEFLSGQPWNPFPTARKTIRPDVAAVNLFDGHVVIIVDTTPVALITPISLLQLLQNPEDYHVSPVYGTYLRWVEAYAAIWAVLIPPVWLLLATHHGLLRHFPALSFLGPKKPSPVPLPLQFLLAEFSIDVLRRAILNSPTSLATSFGILGAVIIGDVSLKTGLFTPEALVYMVGAAIASFAISNLELGMAMRMMRVTLIALEWLWALPGVVVGLLFWTVMAARTESMGTPYLWPLIPFNWPALRSVLIRDPATVRVPRPTVLHPSNRWRGGY